MQLIVFDIEMKLTLPNYFHIMRKDHLKPNKTNNILIEGLWPRVCEII